LRPIAQVTGSTLQISSGALNKVSALQV